MKTNLVRAGCACVLSLSASITNATLASRLNGQAVYDSDLNITWVADANLAATLPFGMTTIQPNGQPYPEGEPGSMFGDQIANDWIDALNAYQGTGYLGFNGWRLTTDQCANTAGHYCADSEFGYLFYNELGGTAYSPISSGDSPNIDFSQILLWITGIGQDHFPQGIRGSSILEMVPILEHSAH